MSHVIGWLVGALTFFGGSPAAPAPQVAPTQASTTAKVTVVTPTTTPVVQKTIPNIPLGKDLLSPSEREFIKKTTAPTPVKAPPTPKKQECNPNYSGCLKPDASDYDCAGGSGNGPYYTGAVRVIGYDEYGLDRDGDGWGCDK